MRTYAEARSSLNDPVTIVRFSNGVVDKMVYAQDLSQKEILGTCIFQRAYREEDLGDDWKEFTRLLSDQCSRTGFYLEAAPRVTYLSKQALFLYLTENGARRLGMSGKELVIRTPKEFSEVINNTIGDLVAILPWSAE